MSFGYRQEAPQKMDWGSGFRASFGLRVKGFGVFRVEGECRIEEPSYGAEGL